MIDYYEVSDPPGTLDLRLLDRALLFGCKELRLDNILLIVYFQDLQSYEFGFCIYDEEETTIILSRTLDEVDLVRTLFHELVHASQHVEGRFTQERKQAYCHGSSYNGYRETPWEQEAFQLETELLNKFYR